MGGLGSGRRRWRLGVEECRTLDVGELCDGGRWRNHPRGTVSWRARQGGELRAGLAYAIGSQRSVAGELFLFYRYRRGGVSHVPTHAIKLDCVPGERASAFCPACRRRVRTLYAPLGAGLFACRRCYRLVYRRVHGEELLAYVQEVAAPALRALQALPQRSRRRARRRYVAAPPPALARELAQAPPLGEAATRLWCLRLRAAGLSYRQIAVLLEFSKSSVARYCRAGPAGIDVQALLGERLDSRSLGPAPPDLADRRSLAAYLRAIDEQARRFGLYHHPLSESEERVVSFAGGATEA